MDPWQVFIQTFVPILAIMDPFLSVPIYLSLTKGMSQEEKNAVAKEAVLVAGIVLFAFLFLGNSILHSLGIKLSALQVGGGIVLMLMGLQLVLGIKFKDEEKAGHSSAGLILGTPLITGPGVITTTLIFSNQYGTPIEGLLPVIAAAATALILTWLIIRNSQIVQKLMGEDGIRILSRVMGLLLVATAVQFMANGGLFVLA